MKKTFFIILVITSLFFNIDTVYAHQLIFSDGMNTNMENSLYIPDHNISWAMYGEVENNVLFYKFIADQKEPFYASIVIPALEGLEDFHPSLAIISERQNIGLISLQSDGNNSDLPFELSEKFNAIVFDYTDEFPGSVFYEPFTQVNYWERQEIRLDSINPGSYYLAVFNTSENGKFALAVGEIEDFRNANFFDSFIRAWFETKIFFDDYFTVFMSMLIIIAIFSGIGYGTFRVGRRIIRKSRR
tara:strand:+ start:601 stop:1332 length:732 start_codon:yes stop_codon:yes gene_type:complete